MGLESVSRKGSIKLKHISIETKAHQAADVPN